MSRRAAPKANSGGREAGVCFIDQAGNIQQLPWNLLSAIDASMMRFEFSACLPLPCIPLWPSVPLCSLCWRELSRDTPAVATLPVLAMLLSNTEDTEAQRTQRRTKSRELQEARPQDAVVQRR